MSSNTTAQRESSNSTQTELSDFSAEASLFQRLTEIDMIGEKRARRIIESTSYDSMQELRDAPRQELIETESIGTRIVMKLKRQTDQEE